MVGGDGPAFVDAANQAMKVHVGASKHQQYIARLYLGVEQLKFHHRHYTVTLPHCFEGEVFRFQSRAF